MTLSPWDQMSQTDPKYTKQASVDGHSQTSISSLYPVKLFTEVYGPIGDRWHFEVMEERFDNTRPIMRGAEPLVIDGVTIWEQVHTVKIGLYIDGKSAGYQYGHTPYRYMTKSGAIMVDKEFAKKSLTDALKKVLSLHGVCADVFLGEFDDAGYLAEAHDTASLARADKSAGAHADELERMRAEFDDAINAINLVPDKAAASRVAKMKMRFFGPRLKVSNPEIKEAATKCVRQIEAAVNSKEDAK